MHVASYVLSIGLVHPCSHSNAMEKLKDKVRVFVSVGWKRQSHGPVFFGLWVLPGGLVGSEAFRPDLASRRVAGLLLVSGGS